MIDKRHFHLLVGFICINGKLFHGYYYQFNIFQNTLHHFSKISNGYIHVLAMQNTLGHFDCIFVFQQDVIKSALFIILIKSE